MAKALCTRERTRTDEQEADFDVVERAIREIERQLAGLNEIERLTGTIQSNSTKILKRASLMRESLTDQVSTLDECVAKLQRRKGKPDERQKNA